MFSTNGTPMIAAKPMPPGSRYHQYGDGRQERRGRGTGTSC